MIPIDIAEKGYALPDDSTRYILARNGVMMRKRGGFVDALVPVTTVSRLAELTPWASLLLPPLPAHLFRQIFLFFKEIYTRYDSEALVLLYLDCARQAYRLFCPAQKVTHSSVKSNEELEEEGPWRVGSIHSHVTSNAYHSATDQDDEKHFDGLHITLGQVHRNVFSLAASVAVNGFRLPVPPEDFILGLRPATEFTPANFGQLTLPFNPPSCGGGTCKVYRARERQARNNLRSDELFEFVEHGGDAAEPFPADWLTKIQPQLGGIA